MNNLNNLRDITDKALCGLTADESLKHRILQRAASTSESSGNRPLFLIPVCCTVLAVLLVAVSFLNGLQPVTPAAPGEINVFAAGNDDTMYTSDHDLTPVDPSIPYDTISSVELTGFGVIEDPSLCSLLFSTIQEKSVPAVSPASEELTQLTIVVNDGTVIHFETEDPYIFSDQCWYCPEFFELVRQSFED